MEADFHIGHEADGARDKRLSKHLARFKNAGTIRDGQLPAADADGASAGPVIFHLLFKDDGFRRAVQEQDSSFGRRFDWLHVTQSNLGVSLQGKRCRGEVSASSI
jgi:hypothetical protein